MATCAPRSVLGAGDRPARIQQLAAQVEAAARQLTQRVQPHAGAPGGNRGLGAIPHGGSNGLGGPILDALRNLGNAMSGFAREVGDSIRETTNNERAAQNTQPLAKVALRIIYQPYTEPMFIENPAELITAAVMCWRAVPTANPSERLLNGSECDFDFADNSRLKINSIDGMTPDASKMITWTFVYVGV